MLRIAKGLGLIGLAGFAIAGAIATAIQVRVYSGITELQSYIPDRDSWLWSKD